MPTSYKPFSPEQFYTSLVPGTAPNSRAPSGRNRPKTLKFIILVPDYKSAVANIWSKSSSRWCPGSVSSQRFHEVEGRVHRVLQKVPSGEPRTSGYLLLALVGNSQPEEGAQAEVQQKSMRGPTRSLHCPSYPRYLGDHRYRCVPRR